MNRLTQKVKDIVEVRSSPNLTDFLADPAATLNGYHFTDITSDLMAKWIDSVADTKQGKGAALALAGFRGVGKSHFLAVLAAILSQPELRSGISDSHISATAQRLSRRQGLVGHVRRGSGDSLLDELRTAIAETLSLDSGGLSNTLTELLEFAASKATDLPFVLLIDTASDREAHVSRDDGAFLSEVAEAAKAHGLFIGLALDDDIAGADGMNSSIASSYSIDFLDQEHLYKIVNAYVFAKRDQMRPVLHDIYESYRTSFPEFRWSEHRFLSLYPLHPAILEIAPFIRLYLHDFALLGFASEAGVKILGRPANSLIGLDEVFDSIENQLRAVPELSEALTAYDELDRSLIAQMPVMKRHEAKLILKGLFLLSFNDESISAQDLSAAMLIMDQVKDGSSEIEAVLSKFAEALPGAISTSNTDGRETKYSFKLGSKDDLNSALAAAGTTISHEIVRSILRRQTAEKFSDFAVSEDESDVRVECQFVWRGGIRRGEVVWQSSDIDVVENSPKAVDWKLYIDTLPPAPADQSVFHWKLGSLTDDDKETIHRFHLLQTDSTIREKFRDLIPTAVHVHSIAVDKIWQRIFMLDGRFISGQNEYRFTEEASTYHTLSQLLAMMTAGTFEEQYSEHPEFKRVLGEKEASRLSEHLFSGSRAVTPETQDLAASFALPLGLVREVDGAYIPLTESELAEIPIVKDAILDLFLENKEVSIAEISERMRRQPYGLTLEAQHLILASIVAQRRFEFVTSAGNRIHHRSLDLQIIWDDIVGLATPSSETYSHERLLIWAGLITNDESLKSAEPNNAREMAPQALAIWLKNWQERRVLERFDLLADEKLNSRIWRVYASVKKTFGDVADSIKGLSENNISLDDCLQNIADAFCDSEAEFVYKQKGLVILWEAVESAPERDRIHRYLANCDAINDIETARLRASLMEMLADGRYEATVFEDKWQSFRTKYLAIYSARHDEVMGGESRKKLDDFLSSDLWSRFSELSTVQLFGKQQMEDALRVIRELRRLNCLSDVRSILEDQPICVCGLDLSKANEANVLIAKLNGIVRDGLRYFSERLNENSGKLERLMDGSTLDKIKEAIHDPANLAIHDIRLLRMATKGFAPPSKLSLAGTVPFESLSDILLENELGRLQELAETSS